MGSEVKLSRIENTLETIEYPVDRDSASATFSDVTVLLADGERNLGELIAETSSEQFRSVEELESELNNTLPREAVGEPYQSEGEG